MNIDWKKYPAVIRMSQVKFRIGDRVKLSDAGNRQFQYTPLNSTHGEIVGFGRDPQIVRVILDSEKSVKAFHMEFWQKETP